MSGSSSSGRGRPNVLFIQTDSQDGRVLGCTGHPAMGRATPNIDALARDGTLFGGAYCNNPICCPSRSSMWSGQWTHHCGGWNNFKGLEPGTPTFQTRLDEAGYLTQTFGKLDYLSGSHTVRARVSAWTRSASILRPAYSDHAPVVRDDDSVRVHEHDWRKIDDSTAWLSNVASSDDRPFMLYVGISAPHPGFTTSRLYHDRIDQEGIAMPPEDEQDHPVMRYMRTCKNWEHGWGEDMMRRVRGVYFAMIAEVDAMVGRLLGALDELGLAESTYVIFTSDHGEMAGEHRQYYKMCHYEPSARVPLIVRGPGVRRGARTESLVSLVDMYPTLMDLAGAPHPDGLDGQSLMGELTGQAATGHDQVLAECHDSSCSTGSFMLRRGDWKYIAYVGYAPQLFDLAADPWEIRNLAGARPDIVAEMDRRLRDIVDYEAVDARIKAHDRRSFAEWRGQERAAGTYERTMARIHSGWDAADAPVSPWTAEDEARIERWLAGDEPGRA